MVEVNITLSANAGISVQIGTHRIWVDALHEEKQPGFSAVSAELYQQILQSPAFAAPEYICVTHCHPDHYSERMLQNAKQLWQNAQICLPKPEGSKVENEKLTLEFFPLPHEGAQYADVVHCGIIIGAGEKNILIAGDCETASPALMDAVGERQIDLAILNFPWVTLSKGRVFLTQKLKPGHILLCHLPFEEDDVGGFRASTQRNALLLKDIDVRILSEPLQTEIINI